MMPTHGSILLAPTVRQWHHSNDTDEEEPSGSESEPEDDHGFRPLTESDVEDNQFHIQGILDKRAKMKKGKRRIEYLVVWAGTWSKKDQTSWVKEKNIDPDEVYAYNVSHPDKAHIGKDLPQKTKVKAKAGGFCPFLDLEAMVGGDESDDESSTSIGDEGEDVDSDGEGSDSDGSDDAYSDSDSEYSPSDDKMEEDAGEGSDGDHDPAQGDESSQEDSEAEADGSKEATAQREGTAKDDEDSEMEDSEEDAEGEEISEEEQALYASRSVFGK